MSTLEPIASTLGVPLQNLVDGPVETDEKPHEPPPVVWFRFEIGVPYQQLVDANQLPAYMSLLGEKMQQMGLLFVDSARPGSVILTCMATDKGDVARFFAALLYGTLDSLLISNPQILTDDPPIEDEESTSEDVAPSELQQPSLSKETTETERDASSTPNPVVTKTKSRTAREVATLITFLKTLRLP
jgi:mannitol-specific phosphotransferase system IIBC component